MKNKYYISLAILTALCACQKEDKNAQDGKEPGTAVEMKHIEFASSITKTTLDGSGDVSWEANDNVSVWYLDSENNAHEVIARTDAAGTSSTLSIDIPAAHDPDHFYAAYPAGSGTLTYDGAEEHFTLTVGAGDGSFKAANYMAAYTTEASKSFNFKNAVGIIRVALPASGSVDGKPITAISIASQTANVISRGTVEALVSADDITGYSAAVSAGAEDYAYTTVDAAAIAAGYAYIPTLPVTYTAGFAIRYNAKEDLIPALLPQNAVTIEKGHVQPISDLSGSIVKDWYVSADGSGNGRTAASPMSFAAAIAKYAATSSFAGAWHLNGTTFHLASGTYTLTEPLNFPKAAEHFESAIAGAGAATTILDGNATCKVMTIESDDIKLSLSNLTVQNGAGDHGAGIDFVPEEIVGTDEQFVVDVENCVFKGNASTAGGAAMFTSDRAQKGFVRLNNCLFESNVAGGLGGALLAGQGVFIMFNNCSFVSNGGVGSGGHVIYMNNAACRMGMNNCTVYHNDANNAKNEGAVAARGYSVISNSTLYMDPANPLNGTNWGCLGMISAASGSGLAINSVIHGTNAIRGLATNAHHKYCIYTSVLGSTTISDSYLYSSFPAPTEETATINGVEQTYYTWSEDFLGKGDFPDDYVSQATLEAAISAVPSIGAAFLAWVNSKGGLANDIVGADRTADGYIYPGSVQQ